MNRRRFHLEVLVCGLLLAALVVQPAAAGKGGPPTVPGPPPHANAQGPPAHAQGNGPPVDPTNGAAPPEDHAPGPPAHAQGNGTGPPPHAAAPAHAAAAPEAAEDNPAKRGASPSTNSNTPATGARIGPGANEASAETPQSGAVAVPAASAPSVAGSSQPPGGGSVSAPDTGTTSRPPRAGGGSGANAPSLPRPGATAAGILASLPPTTSAVPGSALEIPLVTPATEAITRVRPAGPIASGGPELSADGVDPLPAVQGAEAGDSSVAEVLFSWAKYALALLGLLVLALGAYTIVATARTRRLERQREALMEDIGLLQKALLPAVPARIGALLTTVAYRPADGPGAGGDFYDAFPLGDGRVGVLLGDVSGHGRQALAKTALVRFTVRAHLEAGLSPREALALTGRSLDGGLADDFATVIAAVHDPVKGTLTYASAGHPPPIVTGPPRHRPVTASSAPPIGVGFPTGQRQTILPMPEGASVMIYSDGLLESRIDGVPVGPDRLAAWLEELGPEATAQQILERVVTHADRVPDDLAAVLLHAAPGATAPAARIEQLKLDVLDMDGPDLEGFLRGAGVAEADRLLAGRRVSELLARTSGVIVEVRTGEHPMVSVAPIGDDTAVAARPSARAR